MDEPVRGVVDGWLEEEKEECIFNLFPGFKHSFYLLVAVVF